MARVLCSVMATAFSFSSLSAVAMAIVAVTCPVAQAADGKTHEYVNTIAELREPAGGHAIASIMPATAVSVLATQGTAIEVEVTGWSPAGGAKYMFRDVGQRITLALLTEDGVSRRTVVGTKDDDWGSTWQEVRVTGWLERKDVVADLAAVWQEASKLYHTRCSRCHSLHRPEEFTANQWPGVLKIMNKRSGYSPIQAALVTALLQAHGKDQKSDGFFSQSSDSVAPPTRTETAKIVGTPELAAKGGALFDSTHCASCHGKDGNTPTMPGYPKLGGQTAEYLFRRILEFKSGAPINDAFSAMKSAVASISEDDARAIAYWLSTK